MRNTPNARREKDEIMSTSLHHLFAMDGASKKGEGGSDVERIPYFLLKRGGARRALTGMAFMGVPDTRSDCDGVRITPSHIVRRQMADWSGLSLGSVQLIGREQFEYRYKGARHLLIASERAEREQGETLVEGLPKSTQREFSKKLSLIPAGHEFHGWQKPRVLTRVTYLYIDPNRLTNDPDLRFAETELTPRLFFFDQDLWETSQKL